jgi:hypothetical protein
MSEWNRLKAANARISTWVQARLGPIVLSLAVLIGATSWYQMDQVADQGRTDKRVAECQARYNQAFAQQLIIRSKLFSESDQIRDDLITRVGKQVLAPRSADPAEIAKRRAEMKRYFRDYARKSAASERHRNETPLPPIPDC